MSETHQKLKMIRLNTYLYSYVRSKTIWTPQEKEIVIDIIAKTNKPVAVVRPMAQNNGTQDVPATNDHNDTL